MSPGSAIVRNQTVEADKDLKVQTQRDLEKPADEAFAGVLIERAGTGVGCHGCILRSFLKLAYGSVILRYITKPVCLLPVETDGPRHAHGFRDRPHIIESSPRGIKRQLFSLGPLTQ